jgi:hypothetical protein
MDPLTQGVLGASVPQAISHKKHMVAATLFGAISGMSPDLDSFIRSDTDPLLHLEFHRQFSHSLFTTAGEEAKDRSAVSALIQTVETINTVRIVIYPLHAVTPFRGNFTVSIIIQDDPTSRVRHWALQLSGVRPGVVQPSVFQPQKNRLRAVLCTQQPI